MRFIPLCRVTRGGQILKSSREVKVNDYGNGGSDILVNCGVNLPMWCTRTANENTGISLTIAGPSFMVLQLVLQVKILDCSG